MLACLLPIASCLLPIASCLLPLASCLLPFPKGVCSPIKWKCYNSLTAYLTITIGIFAESYAY
ncbi:hypothetical protein [Moorena sp. SIO3H5]|uniref:hypothetical protein n=1 Tax=Moorena sp. SIO3H5 TaxID=2607834 RepID=UPI0013BB6BD7|nr:hypothetical protein [Moorena sp. SIO3H5]NEO70619.1 hypothetical protein [Moorena sp. SIO3H5]